MQPEVEAVKEDREGGYAQRAPLLMVTGRLQPEDERLQPVEEEAGEIGVGRVELLREGYGIHRALLGRIEGISLYKRRSARFSDIPRA